MINVSEQGQIVMVRQRRHVVADVLPSSLSPSLPGTQKVLQHFFTLLSIEDDALGKNQQVIWDLELGAQVSLNVELPDRLDLGPFQRLDAHLCAIRRAGAAGVA